MPRSWPDLLLAALLALLVMPAVFVNALVWYEHLLASGVYGPDGRNLLSDHRPFLVPLLVGIAAVLRLATARVWLIAPRYRRALCILGVVALLTAAASQIREPAFSAVHGGP